MNEEFWPFVVVFGAFFLGWAFGYLVGYRRGQLAERVRIAFMMSPATGGKVSGSLDHLRDTP